MSVTVKSLGIDRLPLADRLALLEDLQRNVAESQPSELPPNSETVEVEADDPWRLTPDNPITDEEMPESLRAFIRLCGTVHSAVRRGSDNKLIDEDIAKSYYSPRREE